MFAIITGVIAVLVILTGLVLDFYVPADMKPAYQASSRLWGGFVLLWITAFGAFSPRDLLRANAEWIGSKNPQIARIACMTGMVLALGMIAISILQLLHRM